MSKTTPEHHEPPYAAPQQREFVAWLDALGLVVDGNTPDVKGKLSYDEFLEVTDHLRLLKRNDGPLYGFWRAHGDVWGEPRTVREWLTDFEWGLVDPAPQDIADLDLFLGHDEFWEWSNAKVEARGKPTGTPRWMWMIVGLFILILVADVIRQEI